MKGWTKQRAIEFALDLEDNEAAMAENAAMAVTLSQYGLEWGDQCDVLMMLPDGNWWIEDARLSDDERQALIKRDAERATAGKP